MITLALLTASFASPAAAEPPPSVSEGGIAAASSPDDGWRYNTYYIYPLTRHLGESGIKGAWRYTLYPFTALLDTAQLPFGALAGLFGD